MQNHENPVIAMLFATATGIGILSLQELNDIFALILKIISIITFLITGAYTIYKWQHQYRKNNIDEQDK
jgi:hypothetical protein